MGSTGWQRSCSTIQDATSHLLKSGKFSDVVFIVGETKIPVHAHKLIIMSRSSEFEDMFERWKTKCPIEIPEVTLKSFQLFLEVEDAPVVLYLAHKYCSYDIAKLCTNLLRSDLQIGNVIHIHKIASRLSGLREVFEFPGLRKHAMDFILRNGKSVFQNDGFLEMDSETLSAVLKEDMLIVDELTVFQAVMRWAENRCKMEKLDNTVKNKRIILKDILHLIRFPVMEKQDFTDEVVRKNKGILTDDETIGIYEDFSAESSIENLRTIPWNRDKRRSRDDVYRVEIYSPPIACFSKFSTRDSDSESDSTRETYKAIGDEKYHCSSTLTFRFSANISLIGIELHAFQGSRQQGYFGESEILTNSEFTVSVEHIKRSTLSSVKVTREQLKKLLTSSPVTIDFDSEISILKNDLCEIKLTFVGNVQCPLCRGGRSWR